MSDIPDMHDSGGTSLPTPEEILENEMCRAICDAAGPDYLLRTSEEFAQRAEQEGDQQQQHHLAAFSDMLLQISRNRRIALQHPDIPSLYRPTVAEIRRCLSLVLALEAISWARRISHGTTNVLFDAQDVLESMTFAARLRLTREAQLQYQLQPLPPDDVADITDDADDELSLLLQRFRGTGFS